MKNMTVQLKPTLTTDLAYQVLENDDDIVHAICRHITMGGSVTDFCATFKIDYFSLMKIIKEDKQYAADFKTAKQARNEFIKDKVTGELMNIASSNITDAYEGEWRFKSLDDIPENIKALISSYEESDTGIKVKFIDKTKALDMLAKQQGMYVQKHEVKTEVTLESLLTQSYKEEN